SASSTGSAATACFSRIDSSKISRKASCIPQSYIFYRLAPANFRPFCGAYRRIFEVAAALRSSIFMKNKIYVFFISLRQRLTEQKISNYEGTSRVGRLWICGAEYGEKTASDDRRYRLFQR